MSVTDVHYWDDWWSQSRVDPFPPDTDQQFGPHGYFLRMIDRHNLSVGDSAIELGGVRSFRLLALAKWRGLRVTAADYSRCGMEATREWFAANGCSVETIEGDFFSLPHDRKFDLVTHWGVMEHESDPRPLLQLCARLVKPTGTIVFSMPNMRGPGAWAWKHWSPNNWAKHIYHSDREIVEAATSTGLTCSTFGHGAPFIYMGSCEAKGALPRAVYLLQRLLDRLGRESGWRYISQSRVFVCHPREQRA
ncbi:MAG: methyltransferase domain-containing protein [Acidobacteriia bacterium]|nr:methyltransferase domain-containing protein [Terriglobia bacterium]